MPGVSLLKALLRPILPVGLRANLLNLLQAQQYYWPYLAWGGRAKPPYAVDIEITLRCNARCLMCPLHGSEDTNSFLKQQAQTESELSTDELEGLLDDLGRSGVRRVQFTGGEPFLREDLLVLVRHGKEIGLSLGIISNGSVITDKIARELVEAGLDTLHLSVDGPPDLHDAIRRVPGLFRRVEAAVGNLNRAKEELRRDAPRITIGATVSTLNQGRLAELVESVRDWNAAVSLGRLFFTTPAMAAATNALFQRGRTKAEDQAIALAHRQVDVPLLHQDLQEARAAARRSGTILSVGYRDADDIRKRFLDNGYTDHNKCFYPWHSARVDPFGNVYPCSMNNNMGNIRETPFLQIWNGAPYVAFRQALKKHRLFPSCTKCCALSDDKIFWRYLPKLGLDD
jgi:Fe-coproporphyrin III synthase